LTTELLKCLPSGLANPTTKPQVAVQLATDATVLEENYQLTPTVLGHRPVNLLRVATVPAAPEVTAMSSLIAILAGGGSGGGSSSHGAGRRAGGGGDRGGRGHANNHVTVVSCGGYDARRRIEEIRRNKTAGENDGFTAFSARLRNLLLPEKFKSLGITKYDAKQDPVQWLKFYALSIENAGGNNDTKCLYFPFCLDQAPLTWLESLEKYSIDKWDQLKDQFTSNFTGAMGRSGTHMDLAMVKQEQGETLRKYMRHFFDKRATVVDVTDKEVIDLFQDDLYHRRTFEDFGRRRLSSITHLKDMITSWADEEDKANTKYDAIRG
jgi:hypothetical protein